jgi:DNA-binding transcriptional ArsR family regulator
MNEKKKNKMGVEQFYIMEEEKKLTELIHFRSSKTMLMKLLNISLKYNNDLSAILREFTEKGINHLLDNPNRKEIINLVKKERLTITEISNKIGLHYRNTFEHIKELEKFGLIEKDKKYKGEQGRKVYIIPTNKTLEDIKKDLGLEKLDKKFKEKGLTKENQKKIFSLRKEGLK